MLTLQQQRHFESKGYVVLEQLFSDAQMAALKSAAMDIVDQFDPDSTRAIFSTHSEFTDRDQYFLTSDDKVRCFFEEDAFAPDGTLTQAKHLSINKIAHALHVHDPVFKAFSTADLIADIAKDVGVVEPEIRQSMYIFKQPKIGGEIRWHQDATYFYTAPISVVTFWFAIEDATLHNGCLQVAASGANFPLKEQFTRDENDHTELHTLHSQPWPSDEEAVALEVKAGSLVVFNGLLPHFSAANQSDHSRHAFTLHITSGTSQYDPRNWLRAAPVKLD
ncbi:phytanoyl-CoA dioxygenase family protein [Alteromonas sp. ASW11-36]|uniref:Phytanoyl-CoA dioxygenase family protein n=1 Tax=Alteromonas arenosi TaxID=3055817 RepID=A0ABT7SVY7_9ALTE|nr:phytanoyl-CoA dioxygenase family protein [Alteromonas sp. ASW11-36]MDM7860346.1 phytanoyl-CoA dioxygenase family protein [Alteromonas sp. ASW11-36]